MARHDLLKITHEHLVLQSFVMTASSSSSILQSSLIVKTLECRILDLENLECNPRHGLS